MLLLAPGFTLSQTPPPPSDIFLVEVDRSGGKLRFGALLNITDREGYDNQPAFLPDGGGLFFTSIREDRQADIYRYDLKSRATARITRTAESEYSPTPMPDGKHFSVVRVEADSTQRLWKFDMTGGAPSLVLESLKPVGYHAWVDSNTVALFVLGEPSTLQIADIRTGKSEKIVDFIGRALQRRPGKGSISFVQRTSNQQSSIKELDVKTRHVTSLTDALSGQEFHVWMPDGSLLSAKDSKLFRWLPAQSTNWEEVADFSAAGLKNITRLAISPRGDRLALVAAGR
jgi:Tol biopolymer transport system component